ncbi:MAG: ATP-binding cassette domain-containing protein [Gammaproteobacteria bacterium]|nr:ATP-binding cassette domain-containing protein [Gammaproteobacteria bacterium]
MSDSLIQIRDLHFSRGKHKIFDGISLDIMPGKITAVMGPSGTGKTTLLKLIAGQLKPDQGTIFVDGENVHELKRNQLYQLRKKMGMLFQSGALLTDLSVFENVAFPLREHTPLSEEMIRSVVLMKLQAVGLRGAAEFMPSALSGGMARRAALARALVIDPMLIMYDEPFTGQDPISMGVLVKLIKETTKSLKITSIVVSHDVHETLSIADHVVILSQGKVVASGSEKDIQSSDSPWVKQFVFGEADGPVPFHFPSLALDEDFIGVDKKGASA